MPRRKRVNPSKPVNFRHEIYSLRHDGKYPGYPDTLRPWAEIARILKIKEPSVRYNYNQYLRGLNKNLGEQKALAVAKALENGCAIMPGLNNRPLTIVKKIDEVIDNLSDRLGRCTDDAAYCGVSMTLLKFVTFKQKHIEDTPELLTSDEVMNVFIKALGEIDDETRKKILNRVVDLLGENITEFWEAQGPWSD